MRPMNSRDRGSGCLRMHGCARDFDWKKTMAFGGTRRVDRRRGKANVSVVNQHQWSLSSERSCAVCFRLAINKARVLTIRGRRDRWLLRHSSSSHGNRSILEHGIRQAWLSRQIQHTVHLEENRKPSVEITVCSCRKNKQNGKRNQQ